MALEQVAVGCRACAEGARRVVECADSLRERRGRAPCSIIVLSLSLIPTLWNCGLVCARFECLLKTHAPPGAASRGKGRCQEAEFSSEFSSRGEGRCQGAEFGSEFTKVQILAQKVVSPDLFTLT